LNGEPARGLEKAGVRAFEKESPHMNELKNLTDQILLERTRELAKEERTITIRVLHHLREVERRRLFVDLGYSTLHAYAVGDLKYCPASASNRIDAMRLLKEIPEIAEKIESGSLNLTLLNQAQRFFKQEAKVEKPVATEEKRELLSVLEGKSTREAEKELVQRSSEPLALRRDSVRVMSETYSEVRFLVTQETLDQLERIRGLLGHTHSQMTLGELLAVMAKITLEKLDPAREPKRKRVDAKMIEAKKAEAKTIEANQVEARQTDTQVSQSVYAHEVGEGEKQPNMKEAGAREFAGRAYIRASLRREVWKRANGKCSGCGGLYRLQIDHIEPIAKGGTNAPENLRLLCFHCNQRQADLKLGREKMERFRNQETSA
jgi:hypothetical protein